MTPILIRFLPRQHLQLHHLTESSLPALLLVLNPFQLLPCRSEVRFSSRFLRSRCFCYQSGGGHWQQPFPGDPEDPALAVSADWANFSRVPDPGFQALLGKNLSTSPKNPAFQHILKLPQWYHTDTIILMAMTLRLTAEEEKILGRLASQLGTSKQKALIEAMKMVEQNTAKKRKLDEALQFVLSNDKELMQRLADA